MRREWRTDAEREVWAALALLHRRNGRWPCHVRDIAFVAAKSTTATFRLLVSLGKKGWVEKGPNRYDGWRPIP